MTPRGDVRSTRTAADTLSVRCRASIPDAADALNAAPANVIPVPPDALRKTCGAGWADVDQNAVSPPCTYGARSFTVSKAARPAEAADMAIIVIKVRLMSLLLSLRTI